MIVTSTIPYRDGELRIGWASWDDGSYTARSIKYAYRDASGKISRGSPELPFDILIDMLMHADEKNELAPHLATVASFQGNDLSTVTSEKLKEEAKTLKSTLLRLQVMAMEVRGADWTSIYDQIGARYDKIKSEMSSRKLPLVA